MALSRVHTTAADGTFSATGATAWNAAHGVTGATSGGIPYFSSTTTELSSAVLLTNGVVFGGGAGNAPFTDSKVTFTAGGAGFVVQDTIKGNVLNAADAFFINGTGSPQISGAVIWSNTAGQYYQTRDTSLSRLSAGVLAAGTGTEGSTAGTFRGAYQAADGTAGVAAFGPSIVTSITIKNGLVVAIS